jgi:hypothetical protein
MTEKNQEVEGKGYQDYKVKRPFQFSHKGQFEKCTFINMKEPKGAHTEKYMALKDLFIKAQFDASKFAKDSGAESSTGEIEGDEQIIEVLSMFIQQSDRVGAVRFIKAFKEMVTSNNDYPILRLNDKENIKSGDFDEMHPDEPFQLAVTWFHFFVTPLSQGQPG